MRPGGDGTSRITDSDVTVLPDPLSPTSPTVSPGPDRERHVVDHPRRAVIGGELHREVLDAQSSASVACPSSGAPVGEPGDVGVGVPPGAPRR